MAAFFGQAGGIARQILAADHVEDDVDAAAGSEVLRRRDEILAAIVDRPVGAERLGAPAFVVAAAGDEDAKAEQIAQADRHRADAAGAAMDEDAFAVAREGALEQ